MLLEWLFEDTWEADTPALMKALLGKRAHFEGS